MRFGFIQEEDLQSVTEAREVSLDKVEAIEKELYKEWWKEQEQKIANGEPVYMNVPSIGAVQLN